METRVLVDSILEPLDSNRMAHVHVHLLGLDGDGSGAWVKKDVRFMWSIIPFYKKMADNNITLISHSGEEHAVEGDGHQACGSPQVDTLLQRQDWHGRMVDGFDYPLPAINFLIRNSKLQSKGYITLAGENKLNQVYKINPLLSNRRFNSVMKHPKTKQRLKLEVIHLPKEMAFSGAIRD